jgi:hypothetical protein
MIPFVRLIVAPGTTVQVKRRKTNAEPDIHTTINRDTAFEVVENDTAVDPLVEQLQATVELLNTSLAGAELTIEQQEAEIARLKVALEACENPAPPPPAPPPPAPPPPAPPPPAPPPPAPPPPTLIEFPASPAIAKPGYEVWWGHMHTLGLDDYDGLLPEDYHITPKTTRMAYAINPALTVKQGLHLSLIGTSTPGDGGYIHSEFAPLPGLVSLRLPNTTAKTSNWRKWDFYLHSTANGVTKHRSINCTVAAIDYLKAKLPLVDTATRGIWLTGGSMGAIGSLAQSLGLPDAIRKDIVVVGGSVGFSFIRDIANDQSLQFTGGDNPATKEAWDRIDLRLKQADPLLADVYHMHVSTINDGAAVAYKAEMAQLFQRNKIAHRWIYGDGTHGTPILDDAASQRMRAREIFESPECGRDNVTPFPAFSGSSADWQSPGKGYWNLGLAWHHANTAHTDKQVSIPIRYKAHKGIGGGYQDQPDQCTVTVTPRKLQGLDLSGWSWEYLGQKGTGLSATITMQSGDSYVPIVWSASAAPPAPPPPAPPPPAPPPAPPPPPPAPPTEFPTVTKHLLNLSRVVCFEQWSTADRYNRYEMLLRVSGSAEVRFHAVNFAGGGSPLDLGVGTYKLLVDGAQVATCDVPSGTRVGTFRFSTAGLAHGRHVAALVPLAGETAPEMDLWVDHGEAAYQQDFIPVRNGTFEVALGGQQYMTALIPADRKPDPKGWPIAPRKAVPFTHFAGPAELHSTMLLPANSPMDRPSLTKEGFLVGAGQQAYIWTNTTEVIPDLPRHDGPRGLGLVHGLTFMRFDRHGGIYGLDSHSIVRISPDGTVKRRAGFVHDYPPSYYADPQKLRRLGHWDMPIEQAQFRHPWGFAWDPSTLVLDEVTDPIDGEQPHLSGPVMYVANTGMRRIDKVQFNPRDREEPAITAHVTNVDAWFCGVWNGALIVADRNKSTVSAYDLVIPNKLLSVIHQGPQTATFNPDNWLALTSHPLSMSRAYPGIAHPEGGDILDDELFLGTWSQGQVRALNLKDGRVRTHVQDVTRGSGADYVQVSVAQEDGFGPRGSLVTASWTVTHFGAPQLFKPDGTPWGFARFSYAPVGKGGQGWDTLSYSSAACIGKHGLAYCGAGEGVRLITLAQAGDVEVDHERYRAGRIAYAARGLNLTHGQLGMSVYGYPPPFGLSADIDYFLSVNGL